MLELSIWIASILAVCSLLAWYASRIFAKVKLYYTPSALTDAILRDCPSLHSRYVPHLFSTVLCGCSRKLSGALHTYIEEHDPFPESTVREEILSLEDGGTMRVDWLAEEELSHLPEDAPVVLVFPQVGTCSSQHGVNALFCHRIVSEKCFRVVQCVYQGLGGLSLTSCHLPSTAYCGTDDVGEALKAVHLRNPKAPVVVLSFSVGAAHFTRWAGANPKRCSEYKVIGLVALSHGFSAEETIAAARHLGGAPGRAVVQLWKEQLTTKLNLERIMALDDANSDFDSKRLLKATTFDDWDEAVLPLYGYRSKEEMFSKCDAVHFLSSLNMPMLFVNAENDPVCPADRMRRKERPVLLQHPLAVLACTKYGGHLGWPDGCIASKAAWIQDVVVEYLGAVFRHTGTARE